MKKHTLKATVIGQEFEWPVQIDTDQPLTIDMARKGYQETLQDAASTAKPKDESEHDENGKATKNCRLRCMRERDGKIKDGTYKPGQGGGGGVHQSPEDKAWIMYFNAVGHKENGKPVNGKTLRRAQEWHVRQILLASADPGSDERRLIEENLRKYMQEQFDEIIEQEQQSNKPIAMGIEYQKMIAAVPSV